MTESELNEIAAQYRTQLENYAVLFVHETYPIKKAILFLSLGKLVII